MFQLDAQEAERSRSQAVILNAGRGQNIKYLPYAFTEHGVLMLAAVLRTDKAIQASIRIIEIFVKMREILAADKNLVAQVQDAEKRLTGHDEDIRQLFEGFQELLNPPATPRNRIGFRRKDELEKENSS